MVPPTRSPRRRRAPRWSRVEVEEGGTQSPVDQRQGEAKLPRPRPGRSARIASPQDIPALERTHPPRPHHPQPQEPLGVPGGAPQVEEEGARHRGPDPTPPGIHRSASTQSAKSRSSQPLTDAPPDGPPRSPDPVPWNPPAALIRPPPAPTDRRACREREIQSSAPRRELVLTHRGEGQRPPDLPQGTGGAGEAVPLCRPPGGVLEHRVSRMVRPPQREWRWMTGPGPGSGWRWPLRLGSRSGDHVEGVQHLHTPPPADPQHRSSVPQGLPSGDSRWGGPGRPSATTSPPSQRPSAGSTSTSPAPTVGDHQVPPLQRHPPNRAPPPSTPRTVEASSKPGRTSGGAWSGGGW